MTRSKDDEEKEWSFTHFEKILAELSSENGTVGNILAGMLYQLANQKLLKPETDSESIKLQDQDKQFILRGEEQENDLNSYFDDLFNKIAIEHNIKESTFKNQV